MALTDNDYSDFEPVNVLDNDIALLPLDGPAEAFQYKKTLIIEVPAFLFADVPSRDISWEFTFRVRENQDGESKISFESETRWTARITVLNLGGGLELITWEPTGDAGAGETTTTILNGEAVDPDEAWKFVDKTRPTQNDGQGYTVFTPEGVAAFGTYYFFADWFSAQWLQNLEEGNILDANDSTSIGNISDEATYEISVRAGKPLVDANFDHFGALLQAYSYGTSAGTSQGYEPYIALSARAYIPGGRVFAIDEDRYGRVWQLVRHADGWFEYVSLDGNRTTQKHARQGENGEEFFAPVWPKEVRQAHMVLDPDDGSRLMVGVDGASVTFKRVRDDGEISTLVGTLPKAQAITLKERNGKLFVIGEAGIVFVSTNRGTNWTPRGQTAQQIAQENGVLIIGNG